MPRAQYIFYEQGQTVGAAYPKDIGLSNLTPIVERLGALPGIKARATEEQEENVVWVDVGPGCNPYRAFQLLKELTDPELPIAIHRLNVTLSRCVQQHITAELNIWFIPPFEPIDGESFELRLMGIVQEMDLRKLWADQDDVAAIRSWLMEAIAKLGAYVSETLIRPDLRITPCLHSE